MEAEGCFSWGLSLNLITVSPAPKPDLTHPGFIIRVWDLGCDSGPLGCQHHEGEGFSKLMSGSLSFRGYVGPWTMQASDKPKSRPWHSLAEQPKTSHLTPSSFGHKMEALVLTVIQSLSLFRIFATPWTTARQASLSITNSRSLLKLMAIESVMPSNHLILCCPLLLLPSIFPSIRVFSNALCIRWPKYWDFSFSISPSREYSGLISFMIDWFDLLAVQVFSSPTVPH